MNEKLVETVSAWNADMVIFPPLPPPPCPCSEKQSPLDFFLIYFLKWGNIKASFDKGR